jgi:hypothetical protein
MTRVPHDKWRAPVAHQRRAPATRTSDAHERRAPSARTSSVHQPPTGPSQEADEALGGSCGARALQESEFRLLFAATTVTRLGGATAPIAHAFGVLDLTGSVSDLGFVMAAGGVPFVAFVLVGGV